jgi:hypothetical protein
MVEIVEWSPRWSIGGVAANFARIQILLTVFDGNPDRWLDQIERSGAPDDEADVPFLAVMKQRLAEDPMLLEDLRRIIAEFAALFGGEHSQPNRRSLASLRID